MADGMTERADDFLEDCIGMAKQKTKTAEAKQAERAVLVTTAHRGVFFGYATDTSGSMIKLRAARNCLYWSRDCRGFLGLASSGPTAKCRVGPAADVELRDVTCVADVTTEAVQRWEESPWS